MLALDKAEDLLANYFKKYGDYFLSNDETDKIGLTLLKNEMNNVASLYQSHRLFVYQSFINTFHSLHVDGVADSEMENTFEKIQTIFDSYYLDAIYYHLILVLEFMRLEYYSVTDKNGKLSKAFDDINESIPTIASNYSLYTFSPKILLTKQQHYLLQGTEKMMYGETKELFEDFEVNKLNIAEYIIYTNYRASACFFAEKYDEAARLINNLLNETALKKYPSALLEIKLFLALQYVMMKDHDLFNQLINSIQRQIRLIGKEHCVHAVILSKLFKAALNDGKKGKKTKLALLTSKLKTSLPHYYTPFQYIRLDDDFAERLASI